jgi:hypothetical protein
VSWIVACSLAWAMLASWMCTHGKILAPNIGGVRVLFTKSSHVTDFFYHNMIVNGRPCITLQTLVYSESSSLSTSQIFYQAQNNKKYFIFDG